MGVEQDVSLAQSGNKEAFVRLIHGSEQTMYRMAKSMIRTEEAIADVIQETILKAYGSITSLKEPRYFKTWLIRILMNECYRMMQHSNRNIVIADPRDAAEDRNATQFFESMDIQDALGHLKSELRVIVNLYYFEDVSVKDIASLLDIPAGTVKSRLSTARKQLEILLSDEAEGGATYDF